MLLAMYGCQDNSKELQRNQLDEAKTQLQQNDLQSAQTTLSTLKDEIKDEELIKEFEGLQKELTTKKGLNEKYSKLLIELIESYGIVPKNLEYYQGLGHLWGVVHSELIDFNGDGQQELYVLLKSSEYLTDEYAHRNQDGYIEEVWGIVDGDLTRLWDYMYTYDSSTASDLALTIVKRNDGTAAIRHSSAMARQGISYSFNEYYTMQNNKIAFANNFYDEKILDTNEQNYYVNDKAVDPQTYEAEFAKYDGQEIPIFTSEVGTKEFVLDLSNPTEQIAQLIYSLTKDINTALYENEEVKNERLEQSIIQFKEFGNIDKRDPSTYENMVASLVFNGLIENSGATRFFGEGYTEEAVRNKVRKYFDVDVVIANLGLPTETDPSSFSWLYYVDGKIQVPATDYYSTTTGRTIDKIVQLSDNLYYAKVNDYIFDNMYHSIETDIDFDTAPYENKLMEVWPDHTKPYLESGLPKYLVLKEKDGNVQLLYQGYLNLKDDELAEFK